MKQLIVLLWAFLATSTALIGQDTERSATILNIDGQNYYVHTVEPKQTLYHLSQVYDTDSQIIIDNNPVASEGLKAGQVLKIPCKTIEKQNLSKRRMQRTFDLHTIEAGETLFAIARHWGVSTQTIIDDNPGIDPSALAIGQTLNIRRSEIGESTTREITDGLDKIVDKLDKVSDNFRYHLVVMGETVYSLGRMYGVSEVAIENLNDLSEGLKAGSIVRIPLVDNQEQGSDTADKNQNKNASREWTDDANHPNDAATGGSDGVLSGISSSRCIVALLLPLTDNGQLKTNFIEFYQGALLAAEELKKQGYGLEINLFDTGAEAIDQIVFDTAFRRSNLIIGPVYENNFQPVADYAMRNGIALVSPLSNMEKSYGSVVYQLSPEQQTKYDKLRKAFEGEKNIVIVRVGTGDDENEIKQLLRGRDYRTVNFTKENADNLANYVSNEQNNLFVVTGGNETQVELVLATLSSIQNKRTSRSMAMGPIEVIGHSRWLRFRNIDRNLYFKLNVMIATSYHADRSNEFVRRFDGRYLEAFGTMPTLFSYRGYDALKLFGDAVMTPGFDFTTKLNQSPQQLLQVGYNFVRSNGNQVNNDWPVVHYHSNYTIEVE